MNEPKIKTSTTEGVVQATNHVLTLEKLLPEVLELIFRKVKDPKDLLSCWNTTPAWGKTLRLNDFYFKMTLPFVMPHLTRRDLLACSNVSKFWNKTVDFCFQEIFPEDLDGERKSDLRKFDMAFILHVINMPSFLNEVTRSTPEGPRQMLRVANPVKFRRVQFMIWRHQGMNPRQERNRPPDTYTFESRCMILCLVHHGHLIRNLHISFGQDDVNYLEKIKLIQSCLKLTPNLRVLGISLGRTFHADRYEEMVPAFNQHMSQNPWSPLEHLKVLTFDSYATHKQFATIANAYGPKILYFEFSTKLAEPNQLLPGRFSCLQKTFCKLSDVQHLDFAEGGPQTGGVNLAAFFSSNQSPLKEMVVEISVEPDEENYVGLTAAANAASVTLEKLHLYYVGGCDENFNLDITKLEKLKLPNLKVLKLDTFRYPSLDFLKKVCPAVETLIVEPFFLRWGGDAQYGCMSEQGKMYEDLYSQHQFWKELAAIRSVDVTFLKFTENHDEAEEIRRREITRKVFTRFEYEAMK